MPTTIKGYQGGAVAPLVMSPQIVILFGQVIQAAVLHDYATIRS